MRRHAIIATLLSMLFAAVSSAQVFYEPVQSQYRTEHSTYYYGGSNPRAHEYAYQRLDCFYHAASRLEGRFGTGYLHRNLIGRPPQYVISDCAIYRNASVYGYTSVDARNEAYTNVPRFFRMADLYKSARPLEGGGFVVPAQAPGTIDIRPYVAPGADPATSPATRSATGDAEPKAILIIPRKTRPAVELQVRSGAAEAAPAVANAR